MASFYLLCQNLSSTTVAVVIDAIQEAEAARLVETHACCLIQAMARMASQKQKFARIRRACIHIQRMYRGYQGRIAALNQRIVRERKRWHRFFTHFAILIQKTFRGYFSRKWRYDYYRQKAYLKEVVARSDGVKASMEEHYQRSAEEEAKRQQVQLTQSFDRITKNLHHLVSTNVIPGVFRDPRTGVARQTVFETDIEKTLRELKISPQKRPSGASLPLPSALTSSSSGGGNPLSLQASCSYTAVKDAHLMEKRLNKIMCLENRDQWFTTASANTAAAMARLSSPTKSRPGGSTLLPEIKPGGPSSNGGPSKQPSAAAAAGAPAPPPVVIKNVVIKKASPSSVSPPLQKQAKSATASPPAAAAAVGLTMMNTENLGSTATMKDRQQQQLQLKKKQAHAGGKGGGGGAGRGGVVVEMIATGASS